MKTCINCEKELVRRPKESTYNFTERRSCSRECASASQSRRSSTPTPSSIPYRDTSWVEGAACRSVDPELFFPEKAGNPALAKSICGRCPVRMACLEYALRHWEYGIWGGLTETERRPFRRAA